MTFFGGNPFATLVGQKIETATLETLASEDWSLNLEICDLINGTEEGPKDAIKALKKRLSHSPKNYTSIMYTLTVLETCVKNCGKRFHLMVCQKDFLQEMVKVIGPKNEPPPIVQEKVLALIQSWADAFRNQPDLSGVGQIYADLKHKGVEFPLSNIETMAPIHTPIRTIQTEARPHNCAPMNSASPRRQVPSQLPNHVPGQVPSGPVNLTQDQKAKLMSELDVVESNVKVMTEMLNELTPGKEHPEDQQLLQELDATCRAMQQRVVELVGRVNDDLLTAELLRINDDLNNLFIRYDRYTNKMKGSNREKSPMHESSVPPRLQPRPKKEPEVSLIDLDDPVPQMNSLRLTNNPKDTKKNVDDFEAFAQSRTGSIDAPKPILIDKNPDLVACTGQTSASPRQEELWQQKDTEFDEIEKWLNENPGKREEGATAPKKDESITSSEFDRFLQERAAAAETLPTIPAAIGSNPAPQQRTMSRSDEKEKKMFAL